MNKNSITVIGLGYIGFPTLLLLSNKSKYIYGYDIDKKKINDIKKNKIKLSEKKTQKLYNKLLKENKIYVSDTLHKSATYIITVQTPVDNQNNADLKYLVSAIKNIIPHLDKNTLIIIESTSPVGTIQKMITLIKKKKPKFFLNNKPIFNICYCPERLLPGKTLFELTNNPRVIGAMTEECFKKASNIYRKFSNAKFYYTTIETAELSKLAENTYRDINIAYANFLKLYSDKFKIDISKLIELANRHPRVNILKPSIGVGGHCIPVDPLFLINKKQNKYFDSLIKSSRLINDRMPDDYFQKIKKMISNPKNIRITILGLSYKENIDDFRNSPSIKILRKLSKLNFKKINYCEPHLNYKIFNHKNLFKIDLKDIYRSSDIIIKLVNHDEFKNINFKYPKITFLDYSN